MSVLKTDFVKIDNFYLADDVLREETPSRKAGVDEETESTLRVYGCEALQAAGIALRFPQVVMATGQVLLQRFYCKCSLTRYDIKVVSLTCLWLAAKLEEVPDPPHSRSTRGELRPVAELNMVKVITVFDRITRRMDGRELKLLDEHSKKYYKMREEVVRVERDLLIAFGFVMHVEHPHKQVTNYLTALSRRKALEEDALTDEQEASVKELMQTSINYVNDSLRTTLCVRFKAEVVACAAIFMAARKLKIPLPESEHGLNWWDLFDVKLADMVEVCRTILSLYELPKASYISTAQLAHKGQLTPLLASARTEGSPAAAASSAPLVAGDPFDTPPGSMVTTNSAQHAPTPTQRPPASEVETPKRTPPLSAPGGTAKRENGSQQRPARDGSAAGGQSRERDADHGSPQGRAEDRLRERAREGSVGTRDRHRALDKDNHRDQREYDRRRYDDGGRGRDRDRARERDSRKGDSRDRKRTPPPDSSRGRDRYERDPKRPR